MAFFRTLIMLTIGVAALWFVLVSVAAISIFVVLPLLIVFGLVGGFFYWRYGKMLTTASVGEIGYAMEDITSGETGVVQFAREMNAGTTAYQTNVNIKCIASSTIRAGDTICVESVNGKDITIKRMEG